MTTVTIAKSLALTPVEMDEVVTLVENVVVAEVVADADDEVVVGGAASQTSLDSTLALISSRHTILTPSRRISRQRRSRRCVRTNAHIRNNKVTQ